MKKSTNWNDAKSNVLRKYPNATCFKLKKGTFYAIFSDSDIVNAKRLSKSPFEGRTANSKEKAWLEAESKVYKNELQKTTKRKTMKL